MHEEWLIEVDLEEFYEQGINEELLIEVLSLRSLWERYGIRKAQL